jgi:hypothetical protein
VLPQFEVSAVHDSAELTDSAKVQQITDAELATVVGIREPRTAVGPCANASANCAAAASLLQSSQPFTEILWFWLFTF